MNKGEIINLFDDSEKSIFLRECADDYSDYEQFCMFKGYVPIPLKEISNLYDREQGDIEVNDENGDLLGYICFSKGQEIDLGIMNDAWYTAYVNEITPQNFSLPYVYKYDYLIVVHSKYSEYKTNYQESSMLWGGFLDDLNTMAIPNNYSVCKNMVNAVPNIILPTSYHKENLCRAIIQPYGFERFLKLYQLLELNFDFDIVTKIRNIGDDLYGIGKILNDYSRKEIDLLKSLIVPRVTSFSQLELILNKLLPDPYSIPQDYFFSKSKIIFFDYTKEGNPFKDKEDKFDSLMINGGFSERNAKSNNLARDLNSYNQLILKMAIYAIYRIRCCIAHNRIGEYVMTGDDEKFVIEFGEELLREILLQVF